MFHKPLSLFGRGYTFRYRLFSIFELCHRFRVNPGEYGQGGKYGQMAYNSHVQEHRSVTKECFISALNSI